MAKAKEAKIARSQVVIGDEDADVGFTQRVLMSLVVDVQALEDNVERVKTQVFAMAKEEGVYIPKWDD